MPADCLFCRIAAGEIPATKLHEDDLVSSRSATSTRRPRPTSSCMPVAHIASAADLTDADGAAARAPVRGRRRDRRASEGLDGGWRLVTQRRAATAASRSTTSTSTCSAAGR